MKTSLRSTLFVAPFVAALGFGGIAAAQQGSAPSPRGDQMQRIDQPQRNDQMNQRGSAATPLDKAPVVGAQPLALTVEEQVMVAKGWSAKKQLLGKHVFNDRGEKIGTIDDLIVAPDRTASFAVISAGGFVGLDKHDVAVPFTHIELSGTHITLPGATKDALKALPEFQYAR